MASSFTDAKPDWNLFRDWAINVKDPQACEYAKQFILWRDEICKKALGSSNIILLNQTRLKVVNRYYEFFVSVPKAHKQCLGNGKHICIFSVFIETMRMLKEHELYIDAPPLFEPPPPPPPAPIQIVEIPGVTAAEFIDR